MREPPRGPTASASNDDGAEETEPNARCSSVAHAGNRAIARGVGTRGAAELEGASVGAGRDPGQHPIRRDHRARSRRQGPALQRLRGPAVGVEPKLGGRPHPGGIPDYATGARRIGTSRFGRRTAFDESAARRDGDGGRALAGDARRNAGALPRQRRSDPQLARGPDRGHQLVRRLETLQGPGAEPARGLGTTGGGLGATGSPVPGADPPGEEPSSDHDRPGRDGRPKPGADDPRAGRGDEGPDSDAGGGLQGHGPGRRG